MKKKQIKNQGGKRDVRPNPRPGTELLPLGPGELPINKITYKLIKETTKENLMGGDV